MQNIEQILSKLKKEVIKLFGLESSGHDMYHLERVVSLAEKIQKREGGDIDVITISALLHDVHRIIQNHNGKFCQPKDSLLQVKKIMEGIVPEEKQEKILQCVAKHEEYSFSPNGNTAHDLETLILQDADRLDAIGAVGIARCFTYGGANNVLIWDPSVPFSSGKYEETAHDPSEIHHFYNKLLRLKDTMNTKTGRKMAKTRHKFMEIYLKEFFKEWNGEK